MPHEHSINVTQVAEAKTNKRSAPKVHISEARSVQGPLRSAQGIGQMAFYLRYDNMLKKMNKGLLGLALSMGLSSVHAAETKHVDVLLIGGGIMSSTLGVWLNELEPGLSMEMIERLDGVALESSNGWNNAGTGHSALAELNYTPEDKNGNVEIPKAIEINEAFQIDRKSVV